MPLRWPPETQAKGHNRQRSSSTVSDSTKNGSTSASRKRPLSLVVAAGRAPLAERSPNATPVPTTPTNATINKRLPSLLPTLPSNRRVSAPAAAFNVEKLPSPPQTRAAAARGSFPSRPSAPIPESAASSVVSSIRSIKKQPDQEDTSLAAPAPQQQPTQSPSMSTITAFHGPPTTARRGPSGTPRRTTSMAVRSPGQSSEHESSVSGPPRRPGLHPRQTLQRPLTYQVPAKTPPRLASTTRGALASSPHSHAASSRSDTTDSSILSALHFMSDPNMPQSNAPSVWEGDAGDASTTFEMETEVAELNDMVDEDVGIIMDSIPNHSANCVLFVFLFRQVASALQGVQVAHTKTITTYKRLLEQAQSNSASQLHALQAELRLLRATLDSERAQQHKNDLARDRDRLQLAYQTVSAPHTCTTCR